MIVLYDLQARKTFTVVQYSLYSWLRELAVRYPSAVLAFGPSECEWIVPGTWPED